MEAGCFVRAVFQFPRSVVFAECFALCFAVPFRLVPPWIVEPPVLCFTHCEILCCFPAPSLCCVPAQTHRAKLVEMPCLRCNTLTVSHWHTPRHTPMHTWHVLPFC